MELVCENGKILMRSLSAGNSVEEISIGSSTSGHHMQDKTTQSECGCWPPCRCVRRPEQSRKFFMLSTTTTKALALMATLDSANNKKNALTNCLVPRPKARGVCGEDCSSSSIKLTNRDHTTLAKLHTKTTTLINAFTCQTEFQPAQPNSRLADAHNASPDHQCNSVNQNFSTSTSSTKQQLETETSSEPAGTASSESSPCASVNPNNMNTERYDQQTGDSESHCNADGESDDVDTLAPPPGTKRFKRKRAAQVHKLSEKRRRDKINKRLRALQDLIPNCTKRDKASVLDEAIEYLKSLRLQLQIMSMFGGLCVPSTQMMSPAYYPTIGSAIAWTFGMAAGFAGHGIRLQMPITHHL